MISPTFRKLLPLRSLLALVLLATTAHAEDEAPPEDLASPHRTMKSFFAAVLDVRDRGGSETRLDDAARCLDLRGVDLQVRAEVGRQLALDLYEVINAAVGLVDVDALSRENDARAVTLLRETAGAIVLGRMDDGGWRFTKETVESIPALHRRYDSVAARDGLSGIPDWMRSDGWLRTMMPSTLREEGFLLEHWQWIGLFLLVLAGIVGDRILVWILGALLVLRLRKEKIETDRKLRRSALRPLGLLAMALLWWAGLPSLMLPHGVYSVLLIVAKGLAAVAAVWSTYRLVDLVMDYFRRKAEGTETRFDDVLVPLLRKTLKVFIAAFGLVFIADNLNVDVTSLLAGLGLGGLAFALAARETVANLFGSVTVILDRPFDIGDWVKIGDVDGNVEKIGFRSTRIRTFYNSQITVPNSLLITAVVDNLGSRQYRRLKTMLSVTYGTPPERIEAFCEGLRELIRRHPYTRKDYYHVYFNAFGPSSLDVLLYRFLETPDWATELREKERLYLDILRLAERLGVEFAFPTQTLFLEKEQKAVEPGEVTDKGAVDESRRLGRAAAMRIVRAGLPEGRRPPPVILGARSLDPELEGRNVGGDEGEG